MESKHGPRDFQGLNQAHRNTLSHAHTPCCSACWQSQHCLCDTHSRRYELAAAGRPGSPRRRIIRRSCLRIGRSGWMPASSITFLLLNLACISEVQTQMFWCLACVLKFGHLTVIHGRADEILLGWYRDQSCRSIPWWRSVTQSKRKCLMSDGFITDNLMKDKKNCDYPKLTGWFAWLTRVFFLSWVGESRWELMGWVTHFFSYFSIYYPAEKKFIESCKSLFTDVGLCALFQSSRSLWSYSLQPVSLS